MISFYQRISIIILKFAFQEVAHPLGQPNIYFGNFTRPKTHFDCSEPSSGVEFKEVLGYTTAFSLTIIGQELTQISSKFEI